MVESEGDVDLGLHPRRRGEAAHHEFAEELVVDGDAVLALTHDHLDLVLVVLIGGEPQGGVRGDGAVARDERLEEPTSHVHAQIERGHVDQERLLVGRLCELRGVDGRSQGDDLVGMRGAAGLLAERLSELAADARHTRLPADEHDRVDLGEFQRGIGDGGDGDLDRAVDEIGHQRLQRAAGDRQLQVGVGGDARDGDHRSIGVGQLLLCGLSGQLQALHRVAIVAQIDAPDLLKVLGQVLHDADVEVVAAEIGVAGGGQHLEHAAADAEHRYIEGATAEVVDQ